MVASFQFKFASLRKPIRRGLYAWQAAVREGWVASIVACLVMSATLVAVIAILLGPSQ
jgi:hypothetical protein